MAANGVYATISGAVAYSWCATPSSCASGFYACAKFSNTSRHISACTRECSITYSGYILLPAGAHVFEYMLRSQTVRGETEKTAKVKT